MTQCCMKQATAEAAEAASNISNSGVIVANVTAHCKRRSVPLLADLMARVSVIHDGDDVSASNSMMGMLPSSS